MSNEDTSPLANNASEDAQEASLRPLCALRHKRPEAPSPAPGSSPLRTYAIRLTAAKWVNGTVLHYCFLQRDDWDWPEAQKAVVRNAFATWKAVGIGLSFVETQVESDAEILIGRLQDNRSWSYVGTEALHDRDQGRTMNFGWDLTTTWGGATALHEIGHTLGMEHEHQNPLAGIIWNDQAVYADLEKDGWNHEMTYNNIIAKLPSNTIDGSSWDPTSIMHYPFKPGLLSAPHPYDRTGIGENIHLSDIDRQWAKHWYPANLMDTPIEAMSVQPLPTSAGAQANFVFEPSETRDYTAQTVGKADARLVVFEERDGEPRHMASSDDAGTDNNAAVTRKFVAGRRYNLRVRMAYADASAPVGLLLR